MSVGRRMFDGFRANLAEGWTDVADAGLLAPEPERHIAVAKIDAPFIQQAIEQRIGSRIAHDEARIDGQRSVIIINHDRVRVAADPGFAFQRA